jgi:hypothetical protein
VKLASIGVYNSSICSHHPLFHFFFNSTLLSGIRTRAL